MKMPSANSPGLWNRAGAASMCSSTMPASASSRPAETINAKDYRRVLEVNLVAPFLLAQAFGKKMLAAGQGSIINIASVAGLLGIADRAACNASEHGLIGLTRTLAAEWAAAASASTWFAPAGSKPKWTLQTGRRWLHRGGHHRPRAHGTFRFSRRHCPRRGISCRRRRQHLHQRPRPRGRRRLDRRWQLGIPPPSPSLTIRFASNLIVSSCLRELSRPVAGIPK